MKNYLVTVVMHDDGEAWWAEAPAIPGWSAAGDSRGECFRMAREGVAFALEVDPDEVTVEAVFGDRPEGLRLRRSVAGNQWSDETRTSRHAYPVPA